MAALNQGLQFLFGGAPSLLGVSHTDKLTQFYRTPFGNVKSMKHGCGVTGQGEALVHLLDVSSNSSKAGNDLLPAEIPYPISSGFSKCQRQVITVVQFIDEPSRLHGQRFETIRQAKDETLAWLLWYNQTRMHSTLGYLSPIQFEQEWYRSTQAVAS